MDLNKHKREERGFKHLNPPKMSDQEGAEHARHLPVGPGEPPESPSLRCGQDARMWTRDHVRGHWSTGTWQEQSRAGVPRGGRPKGFSLPEGRDRRVRVVHGEQRWAVDVEEPGSRNVAEGTVEQVPASGEHPPGPPLQLLW